MNNLYNIIISSVLRQTVKTANRTDKIWNAVDIWRLYKLLFPQTLTEKYNLHKHISIL